MAETPAHPGGAGGAQAAPGGTGAAPAAHAPLTVLAVDDDADVLRATARILEQAGFHVLTGATAAEALELARRHRPALVLLDVMLPDGNGIDVARRLKADPALADVFVILYSGSRISSDDQAKGLSEGLADGYMTRPLGKPELLARIDAFLRIRETQRALRESERKYRDVVERANDGIAILQGGVAVFANEALARLSGYSVGELTGLGFLTLVQERQRAEIAERVRRRLAGEQLPTTYEIDLVRKDGTPFTVEVSAGLVSHAGAPADLVLIRDVTERKRAEEALRDSEARYRSLFERTANPTVVIDTAGNYINGNAAALRFLECTHEELLTKNVTDFVPPGGERVIDEHIPLWEEGGTIETEYCVNRVIKTLELTITPGSWQGKQVVFGIGIDITARKQAENALLESEERFRRVSAATSDFAYSCVRPPGGSFAFDWLTGAVEPITGWSREELLEWGCWKALVLEEDVPVLEERVIGLAPGESSACELRIRDKQGGVRWLAAYSVAEHSAEDPAVHRLYGACQDITARKRAEEGLLESLAAQRTITEGVIAALVRTIEVRDPYTAGHQRRVGELAAAMALRMELGEERAEGLRVAGLLHDVGMVNIPAEILSRPGRLSPLERELVKAHARAGYEILAAIRFPWRVAEIALQHHERLDGSGYPAGLVGEDILPEARILAVADVVEAMASHRPYRPALGLEAALAEVRGGGGTRYDPAAVAACEGVFAQGFVFTEA